MDPGITTAERNPKDSQYITCKSCKDQIHVDDISDHICDTTPKPKSFISPAVLKTTKSATVKAASFMESFLDNSPPIELLQSPQTVSLDIILSNPTTPPENSKLYRRVSSPSLPQSPHGTVKTGSPSALAHRTSLCETNSGANLIFPVLLSNVPISPALKLAREVSISSDEDFTMKARVQKVTVTKFGYAKYSIISQAWNSGPEFSVERRYSEFYDFAQRLYSIYPSKDVWHRLPPKTYCNRPLTDGFLLRRKVGLEGFLCGAIDMLINPNSAGPNCKRTIPQMHILREFLAIPSTRDISGAIKELKRHSQQSMGWTQINSHHLNDNTFEKFCDGFITIKRVSTCMYPARAIFDLLVLPPTSPQARKINPSIMRGEILRKDLNDLWVEHIIMQVKTCA